MGSTVASHGVTHRVGVGGGGRPGRPEGDDDKDLLDSTLGARIEENLVRLLEQAEALLRDNRAAVLAVAHALEANKTVTGDDIEAIIEGRPGPLLDGRPYHFDDVQAALEEYHTLARDAHRDHAAPAAPLPELPAVTPAQEWLESVTRDVGGNGHGEDAADDVGSAETVAIAIPRPESEGERGADQDSEEDWD
jgi:hypothetical protein